MCFTKMFEHFKNKIKSNKPKDDYRVMKDGECNECELAKEADRIVGDALQVMPPHPLARAIVSNAIKKELRSISR